MLVKNILLLFTVESISTGKANPDVLVSTLNKVSKGSVYEHALFNELDYSASQSVANIINTKTKKDLKNYDFVYFRRWEETPDQSMACAIYLEQNAVPFADSESIGFGSRSKLTQYFRLWQHSLPFPAMRVAPIPVIEEEAGKFDYPIVVKATNGTRGESNYLVANKDELLKILKNEAETQHIIQQYIENDGDYRVFVVEGKARLLIYRRSDSYLNNISQGASPELLELSTLNDLQIKDCIEAASVMKREVAGVDLVISKHDGKHYIFEVNRSPQIENSSYPKIKAQALDDYIQSMIIR